VREFLKVMCVLVIGAGAIAAGVAWMDDRPSQLTWMFRLGSPVVALVGLVGFLLIHFRRDKVPDYLYQFCGGFFDRGGFCFTFGARSEDGICFVDAYFQNRHERPCIGRLALRPARGFFGHRPIEAITYEIHCGSAAFGVARMPVPIAAAMQGKRQTFEVGASVDYPQGKGRALRFRDGIVIRANSNFGNAFGTALTVVGALGGTLVLSKPATLSIDLPVGVAEDTPEDLKPEIQTLWKIGDPPLQRIAFC